jgi:hypothetical protein
MDDFTNHSLWLKTTIKAQLQTSDSNFSSQRSEEFVLCANGQAQSLNRRSGVAISVFARSADITETLFITFFNFCA